MLVAAGLFRFLAKRSTASLTPLAVAVTFDAVLTPVQAVLWNLPRARSPLDYVIIALACLAPLLASIVLWGAAACMRATCIGASTGQPSRVSTMPTTMPSTGRQLLPAVRLFEHETPAANAISVLPRRMLATSEISPCGIA